MFTYVFKSVNKNSNYKALKCDEYTMQIIQQDEGDQGIINFNTVCEIYSSSQNHNSTVLITLNININQKFSHVSPSVSSQQILIKPNTNLTITHLHIFCGLTGI